MKERPTDANMLFHVLAETAPHYSQYFRAWVIAHPEHITSIANSKKLSASRTKSFESRLPDGLQDQIPHLITCREQLLFFMDGNSHRRLRRKTAALLRSRLSLVRDAIDDI